MSLIGKTNEEKIWNYLIGKSLNKFGVAGLMGNLYAESGMIFNRVEVLCLKRLKENGKSYTDITYTAAVDSGEISRAEFLNPLPGKQYGYGLWQLTSPSRKAGLYDLAKQRNTSIADEETQLMYLMKELNDSYKSVLSVLKTATSVRQASDIVLKKFECPADTGTAVQERRANYGQGYYDKFAKANTNNGGNTMTENELRQKVVSIAKQYINCKESDGSHRKIIDGYNAVTPLPRSYRVTYSDAWCATFVSFVAIKAGLTDIMPRECGCGAMIQLYQKLGRWVENDAYVPKPGDVILYDWDDNGLGDCVGYPDHVGIVTAVSGNSITVIEGNKNNAVGYRTIAVDGRFIRGYGIPNYASKATTEPSKPTTPIKPTTPPSTGSALSKTVKWDGYVTTDELNVRTWAGKENGTCSFSPLKENTVVGVCDSQKAKDGAIWYYIKYNEKYGFVHSKYIQKKIANSGGGSGTNAKIEYAQSYAKALAGTYKTTDGLKMRAGAGTGKSILCVIPEGDIVQCYGYYTAVNGVKWYFVSYKARTGFVSSQYLKKQ